MFDWWAWSASVCSRDSRSGWPFLLPTCTYCWRLLSVHKIMLMRFRNCPLHSCSELFFPLPPPPTCGSTRWVNNRLLKRSIWPPTTALTHPGCSLDHRWESPTPSAGFTNLSALFYKWSLCRTQQTLNRMSNFNFVSPLKSQITKENQKRMFLHPGRKVERWKELWTISRIGQMSNLLTIWQPKLDHFSEV